MSPTDKQRDAGALLLFHMRGDVEAMKTVLSLYADQRERLLVALIQQAADLAETQALAAKAVPIKSERSAAAPFVRSLARDAESPLERDIIDVVATWIEGERLDALERVVTRYPGNEIMFGLVEFSLAAVRQITESGHLARRPQDSSPEVFMEDYLLWIAGDKAPDEGYTYEDVTEPCYVCGQLAHGRDPQGRPHHVGCEPQESAAT